MPFYGSLDLPKYYIVTHDKTGPSNDSMSNNGACQDSERLFKLKQTSTTREYAIDFCQIASRLNWNDAALSLSLTKVPRRSLRG